MIVYVLSPRAAVIEAGAAASLDIVPIATSEGLKHLPATRAQIAVADPLDPLEVARGLVTAGVGHGDDRRVCVGLGDDSSQAAALVNAALGLAGGRYASFVALERMRDKYDLRQRLGSASPLNGRYWRIEEPAMIAEILKTSPMGIVVKPLNGSGSRGVVHISSQDQLHELVLESPVLVEEYFRGPEYSVETLSWNGVHHPLVVTEKRIGGHTGLVEIGQRQPARLAGVATDRLLAAASEVLTIVDYRYGLSHIEFIVEDGTPRLVEAHGRVGGDRIADLMKWSVGVSGFETLFRAYRDDAVVPPVASSVEAAIEFVDLRSWSRSDDDWLDAVTQIDGVIDAEILRSPDERSDITGSSDRHAQVVVAGTSIDSALRRINDLGNQSCASW